MAHGVEREGKWRANWRMELVASTLHTPSELGVSSISTTDAHTSSASSRLNWRPRRFNGLVRFAERRNLVSARVPSHFKRILLEEAWLFCYWVGYSQRCRFLRVLCECVQFSPIFGSSWLLSSCYSLERVCRSGLRSLIPILTSPVHVPFAQPRWNPSCHTASTFPAQTASPLPLCSSHWLCTFSVCHSKGFQ
jgi:hypothetical protein